MGRRTIGTEILAKLSTVPHISKHKKTQPYLLKNELDYIDYWWIIRSGLYNLSR